MTEGGQVERNQKEERRIQKKEEARSKEAKHWKEEQRRRKREGQGEITYVGQRVDVRCPKRVQLVFFDEEMDGKSQAVDGLQQLVVVQKEGRFGGLEGAHVGQHKFLWDLKEISQQKTSYRNK
jgi:hypothetical protein